MEAQLDIKVYIAKYSIIPSGKNLFQITASDEVPVQFLAESKLPNSDRAVPRAGHAYPGVLPENGIVMNSHVFFSHY